MESHRSTNRITARPVRPSGRACGRIPGSSTSVTDSAVQSTWNSVMTRNGSVFQASYQATLTGSPSEACGTGLSGYPNFLSLWGSQNCALAGHSWQSILGAYYPGLSIGGPPPSPYA